MNSRSELRSSYHVRPSISFHLSCHALFVCLLCIYCFLPPYSMVDPAATTDYTSTEYDYFTDDRTPTVKLPGKQSHSPLPHIAYLYVFICCTRHILLLRYFPISNA